MTKPKPKKTQDEQHREACSNHDERFLALWRANEMMSDLLLILHNRVKVLEAAATKANFRTTPKAKKGK